MAKIYHDEDARLEAIAGQTIAVVGYGNQGRSQALNLRDSGLSLIVGNIRDYALEQAEQDRMEVVPIAEACRRADIVMLLIPDEVMPEVYEREVAPNLRAGGCVSFASGYNVAFGLIRPDPALDVVLIAPRMIGIGVRERFVSGEGFPSFVGVHQNATGRAAERMLAVARGVGSTRAGCIEMSMHDEASLDLFTEQGFGPAFGRVLSSAVELLVEAGYPPEAVLLELYLSGEFAYSFEKMREVGGLEQMKYHSQTSQYGSATRSRHFMPLAEPIKQKMGEVLEQIRSGAFAEEWSRNQEQAAKLFERIREARTHSDMNRWEESARQGFRIGNAARR